MAKETQGLRIPTYFSPDRTEYRCKDPYKVAILRCMGAELLKTIVENPRSVVFVLKYPYKSETDNLVRMVTDVHSGKPLELVQMGKYHQEAMDFIRAQRNNTK
jgi:hypothetical protein